MIRVLSLIAALGALALSCAAHAQLVISGKTITGPVLPGGGGAWLTYFSSLNSIYDLPALTPDSDNDGSVTFDLPVVFSPPGVAVLVDMTDGRITSSGTAGTFPDKLFARDVNGHYTNISYRMNGPTAALLWVRPGVGAWYLRMRDGNADDADHLANFFFFANTSQMASLNAVPPPATGVDADDIVIGTYTENGFTQSRWFGDRIDPHLANDSGALLPTTRQTFREGLDAQAVVNVMRYGGTDGTATVRYRIDAPSISTPIAQPGVDYVDTTGTLTFAPGEVMKTIAVPLIDNAAYRATRSLDVTLFDPAGITLMTDKARIQIIDDDPKPAITLSDNRTIVEGNSFVTQVDFTATLDRPTELPVECNWILSSDATQYANGTFTFTPNGATSHTFTLPFATNRIPQNDRTFFVTLYANDNATPSSVTRTITVLDDDVASVSAPDRVVAEGQSFLTFFFDHTPDLQRSVRIYVATENGTAIAGEDFVALSDTLDVRYTDNISLRILPDSIGEGDETFGIVITQIEGANNVIGRSRATITITDDDAPFITATPSTAIEGTPGGGAAFRIQLSSPATSDVRVRVKTVDGSAKEGIDFVAKDQMITIAQGTQETIANVLIADDDVAEPDETFALALSEPFGGSLSTTSVIGTIVDDDAAQPATITASANAITIDEGDTPGGTIARFTVTLSAPPTSTLTFPYATANGTASSVADYVATSGTLTFAVGETQKFVDVPIVSDALNESDETFFLIIPGGGSGMCTIRNDDGGELRKKRATRH